MTAHAACDGVLLLDKPAGYSSTRALGRARRLLGAEKGGHTGTLDPFATGLLPLVLGEATKFSRFLIDARKAYEAVLALGVETATGDPEGAVTARHAPVADAARIDAVLAAFVGVQEQVPPMHSALHVNGKRLYEYARAGEEVPRAPRRIEIASIRRLWLEDGKLGIAVDCSKGTYVRTLAVDIGRALGCGASLAALRRTAAGPFTLERALTLEAIEADPDAARRRLLPPEALVAGLVRLDATADDARRFGHGQAIGAPQGLAEAAELAVFAPGGQLLGVGRVAGSGRIAPVRLVTAAEPPRSP